MSRISWEISVDQPDFENVILTNSRIRNDVDDVVDQVQESISEGFNLSNLAQNGLSKRINSLQAFLRDGSELQEGVSLPIGDLSVSNVVSINGDLEPLEHRTLPSKIYLTLDSYKEEITNLHEAATEYSNETAYDDKSTEMDVLIAQFADDHEAIVSEAIKLAISRRLLKYGILPDGILSDEQADKVGFDTWFDYVIKEKSGYNGLSKTKQKKILNASSDLYYKKNIAVKNLRKTVWPNVFHGFIPFNPEMNQVFYNYYLNKLVKNSSHTITFNDELSTRLSLDETADALEKIYAPSSFKPKSV